MKVQPMKAGTFHTSSGYRSSGRPDHRGVDFAAPAGTPIYAAAAGLVVRAGPATGFGQWIVIDHQAEFGVDTVYGHMFPRDVLVSVGQRVTAGQVIGRVGYNGEVSPAGPAGAHLHFEVWGSPGRFGGSDRNPTAWLQGAVEPGGSVTPPWVGGGSTAPAGTQFKADHDRLSPADSGKRDPRGCQFVGVHTTENSDSTPALNVAEWQQNPANQSSYQILVDTAGVTVRGNDDNYIPWAAGTTGNKRGLHIAFVGRASRTRAEWLAQDVQLRSGAEVVADWVVRYAIPNRKITAADLRTLVRGIVGHGDISDAWGEVDHTDPGPGFPYAEFVRMITDVINGSTNTDGELNMDAVKAVNEFTAGFNGAIAEDVKTIRDQVVGGRDSGEYFGHDQIDDRTMIDALAVIGEYLNIPGFYDPHGGSLKAKHEAEAGR